MVKNGQLAHHLERLLHAEGLRVGWLKLLAYTECQPYQPTKSKGQKPGFHLQMLYKQNSIQLLREESLSLSPSLSRLAGHVIQEARNGIMSWLRLLNSLNFYIPGFNFYCWQDPP